MSEHKPLYIWSLDYAVRSNERDLWRESYRENCDCARAIERAINENYRDNCLNDCIQPIIERYGFDRVNWVLANTIQEKQDDGRFSQENQDLGKGLLSSPRRCPLALLRGGASGADEYFYKSSPQSVAGAWFV